MSNDSDVCFLVEDAQYSQGELSKRIGESCVQTLVNDGLLCPTGNGNYSLKFIGLIFTGKGLCYALPKYWTQPDTLTDAQRESFIRVLKVIQKCEAKKIERVEGLEADAAGGSPTNPYVLYLKIVQDYAECGAYRDDERITSRNGAGTILWQKTIQQDTPVFQDGQPYYLTPFTCTHVTNEQCVFTRMHKAVVSECCGKISKLRLNEYFKLADYTEETERLSTIGDASAVESMLENELCIQYDSRRRYVLLLMLAYVRLQKSSFSRSETGVACFGSNNFENVWEKVCRATIGGISCKDKIKEFNKVHWKLKEDGKEVTTTEQIPDVVIFDEDNHCLAIFDAKYYYIQFDGDKLKNTPGVEDIRKQYLYDLACKKWQLAEGKSEQSRYNCLLLPAPAAFSEEQKPPKSFAEVTMPFFVGTEDDEISLPPIQAFLLDADAMFRHYLAGTTLSSRERAQFYVVPEPRRKAT